MAAADDELNHLFLAELPKDAPKPSVNGTRWLLNGELKEWTGERVKIMSPVYMQDGSRIELGEYPMMTVQDSLDALEAAKKAFNRGLGVWPQMSVKERIQCVEKFVVGMKARRDEVANILMWEICKNKADATKEVDRTVDYINDTIKELKNLENANAHFFHDGGVLAQIRRVPMGVVLNLGPFNFPVNELMTTLFPALLMGNCCIVKTPRTGGMSLMPFMELFRDCFPPGVVNIIHGSGRTTLPPLMEHGGIDVFAFIGTSKAAVELQKVHPHPNRLRVCLGLDAKNPGIVTSTADMDVAVAECLLGTLSFNGQRCTALKTIYVDRKVVDEFLPKFCKAVDALKMGMPWEAGVSITPLPEPDKPGYLRTLIEDAVSKGAKIVNARGGKQYRSLVAPTILYPVTKNMRVYEEEQFGPLIPIITYDTIEEVMDSVVGSSYGQQASVFSKDHKTVSRLVDFLVNQVSRVNINSQCQRGPDALPFTGRKNSACGTLSISDALRVFSIRSVMATKDTKSNQEILSNIMNDKASHYLRADYLF